MSFNGTGTFVLNSTGLPVVTGTTISSTMFNAFCNDLATGLSTCLLKDGQQTVTANIPMSSFKLTGLAAGSAAGDSARYEQLGLTLLATQTASSSTTLDFTSGLTSTYSEYLFVIVNLLPSTNDATADILVSENAGGAWKTGASDYTYVQQTLSEATGASSIANDTANGNILITGGGAVSSTAANGGICGELRMFNPAGATHKLFQWHLSFPRTASANHFGVDGYGRYVGSTNAVTGVRFEPSAGNWTSGAIYLFGVRKS